jgi:hypothetical protein
MAAPKRLKTWQKATALIPLALLSGAWTTSLTVTTTASADSRPGKLPDGTTIPEQAISAPASVSSPGEIAPGVPVGSAGAVIAASSTNGIPAAALSAYQRAAQVIDTADKTCHLDWTLIGAIGRVESNHGRYGGNTLDANGVSRPGIYGIPLDGSNGTQKIADTDAGQYDHDPQYDRAVGPLQFIPATWSVVGVDGDGDGRRNPQDIDDAALATAVYLCSGKEDLSTTQGQRSAVYRYNHSQAYVNLVLSIMRAYASGDYAAVPTSSAGTTTFLPSLVGSGGAPAARHRTHHKAHRHGAGTRAASSSGGGGGLSSSSGSGGGGSSGSGGSGGSASSGGGSVTGGGGTPSVPAPTKAPAADPVAPVKKTVKKVVAKVTAPVTSPTPDPGGTTTKTLTKAQATTQCLNSGISKLDVAALNACVAKLLGG